LALAHNVYSPCNPGWPNLLWKPPRPPQCPGDLLQQPHAGGWTPVRSNVQPHNDPVCTRMLSVSAGYVCHDHRVCINCCSSECGHATAAYTLYVVTQAMCRLKISSNCQLGLQLSTAFPMTISCSGRTVMLCCNSHLVCSMLLSHARLLGRLSTVVHLLNSPG